MLMRKEDKTLVRETIDIAWPAVLESVFVVLAGMIDTYMVSHLGQSAVAAVGLTGQPKYFVFVVFFAMNIAISALAARRKGSQLREEANSLFVTGLLYTIFAGIVLSIVCVVFAGPIIRLCGGNHDTTDIAVVYYRIIMGCMLFHIVSMFINSTQRGIGNTKISMYTNVTSNVVNIFCNYLLINGNLGFPALGAAGAAIATVIGTVVACVMSILSLGKKDGYVSWSYIVQKHIRPTLVAVKDLASMGTNILGELLLTRVGFMLTAIMTARIGTDPFAAYHVGMNFMNLGFAFGDGMQMATVALIGRSLGEKDVNKAKTYGRISQKIGFMIAINISLIMVLFGRPIFGLFFEQEYMVDMCKVIYWSIAVIMPIQICKIIFNGILRGAGDVRYTLFASAFSITLVQPALTYLLLMQLHMGLKGVWISILIIQTLQLVLFVSRYLTGKWTQKKI